MAGADSADWEKLVQEALSESDPQKLASSVALAQEALQRRLSELLRLPNNEELVRIYDALNTLRVLDELGPGGKRNSP
jgi:hypothetical protein